MEHSLWFVWLEITGRCQLECTRCYADSGPKGTHGRMTDIDWHRVIEDAARLGVGTVQFIGGEPTLHPALPRVGHALAHRMGVEVFTNLVHVTPRMWDTITHGLQSQVRAAMQADQLRAPVQPDGARLQPAEVQPTGQVLLPQLHPGQEVPAA